MIKVGDFIKYTGNFPHSYTINKLYEIYYSDIKTGYIIDDYGNKSRVSFEINTLNTVYWKHITLRDIRKQKIENIIKENI